jgi:hypothetical protein
VVLDVNEEKRHAKEERRAKRRAEKKAAKLAASVDGDADAMEVDRDEGDQGWTKSEGTTSRRA